MKRCGVAVSLNVLIMSIFFKQCYGWFVSGDLSWSLDAEEPLLVHFSLDVAWERDAWQSTLSKQTALESNIQALRDEWLSCISGGPGSILNVTEGSTPDVRRSVYTCMSQECRLQTNASRFNFKIVRLDDRLVYSKLVFSHTYQTPGVYQAFFQGCCRSSFFSRQGSDWHIRTTVDITGNSYSHTPFAIISPILPLIPESDYQLIVDENATVTLTRFQFLLSVSSITSPESLSESEILQYYSTQGVALSEDGRIKVLTQNSCQANPCFIQISLAVRSLSNTRAVDFIIRVSYDVFISPGYSGFLVTRQTTQSDTILFYCSSSLFWDNVNSSYLVSQCISDSDAHLFACDGYVGKCPTAEDASYYSYDSHLYSG
eukprot:766710-Hanusia_phi.AAC.2